MFYVLNLFIFSIVFSVSPPANKE